MKKKNGKRSTILILVLLLLVGLSSAYVASTYAKYTEVLPDKTGTAYVAHWEFGNENADSTVLAFTLGKTYDETTLVDGKIAPGTEGYFTLELTNANTETGVDYQVKIVFDELSLTRHTNADPTVNITEIPYTLKFYKDQNKQQEITDYNVAIEGHLDPNQQQEEEVKIYWAWDYTADDDGSQDAQDTTFGMNIASLTIPVEVTGVQSQPTEQQP